jgi:DNA-binding GntR family transcriptional regulator
MIVERRRSIASQATTILSERIRTQVYAPGSRLPSESELAIELGVSRASIRSALGRLAAEGLVIRKQGDGTYVNAHIEHIPTRLGGLWSFNRLIDHSGHTPHIRLLDQTVRQPDAAEAEALRLTGVEPVLSLARIFYADDIPAILAYSLVPLHMLQVPVEECDGSLPLSEFVQRYYKSEIAYVIFDIEAIVPNETIRTTLDLAAGQPLLKLSQVFYDKVNQPVFYSIAFCHDKIIRLRLAQAWE